MNLPARNGVSLLIMAAVWLVSTLVQRRVRQQAARAAIDYPAEDVGLVASH